MGLQKKKLVIWVWSFFLKITLLKASAVNVHGCFVCIALTSKETFRGKSSFCIGSSLLRFVSSEVVLVAIMWSVNASGTVQCDKHVESSLSPKYFENQRTRSYHGTEVCIKPFWGSGSGFIFGRRRLCH